MNPKFHRPKWVSLVPQIILRKLDGRDSLISIINNSGWLLFDKLLRAFFALFVGAYVARYLGPIQFGELTYYIAFIAIFQSIANLGLDGIVVREISTNKNKARAILKSAIKLKLVAGVGCFVCAIVCYGFFNNWDGYGLSVIGVIGLSLIFQVTDTVDLWLQSESQNKKSVITKSIAYTISNGLKIALVLVGAPFFAFVVMFCVEASINSLAMYIAYTRHPCRSGCGWDKALPRKLLLESWPYIISGVSIAIYMRIDQIMIKDMLDSKALGIYAAAIPFSSVWNIIPVALSLSAAPFIAKKAIIGDKHFENSMLTLFRVLILISLSIIIFTQFASKWLIVFFYGSIYEDAHKVLDIYILTAFPIFMGVAQNVWLVNKKLAHISLIQTVAGAIFSIACNYFLLPVFGVLGAAISAVFSQLISAVLINSFVSKKLFMMQLGIRVQ